MNPRLRHEAAQLVDFNSYADYALANRMARTVPEVIGFLRELVRTATAIAARYMGPERAEEYGKRNGVPGELVVVLRPTKVITGFDISG